MRSEDKKLLIIGGKAKRHWDQLEGCFAKSTTHALVKATRDDAEGLLEECRKLNPCVLIIDFDSIAKVDPRVFGRKVQYGRLIPVLVLVEEETTADCESLLRMGCMGFLRPGAPPWQFRRAVDTVTSGEIWAPRKFVSQMCRELLFAFDPLKLTARRPFEQKDCRSPVYQSRHGALAHAGDLPKAWGSRSFERALVCFGAAWTKTSAPEGNCETLVDLVVLF